MDLDSGGGIELVSVARDVLPLDIKLYANSEQTLKPFSYAVSQ